MLSLMNIERERLARHSGRQAGRRGDACAGKRPDEGVRNFYRKYAERGGVTEKNAHGIIVVPWALTLFFCNKCPVLTK